MVAGVPIVLGRGALYSGLGDALGWTISMAGILISVKAAITVEPLELAESRQPLTCAAMRRDAA
jgi:hypothetical protein